MLPVQGSLLPGSSDSLPALIPAIALTGYATVKDRDRALAAGYQLHLAKPVEPDELVTAIRNLLDRRERKPCRTLNRAIQCAPSAVGNWIKGMIRRLALLWLLVA